MLAKSVLSTFNPICQSTIHCCIINFHTPCNASVLTFTRLRSSSMSLCSTYIKRLATGIWTAERVKKKRKSDWKVKFIYYISAPLYSFNLFSVWLNTLKICTSNFQHAMWTIELPLRFCYFFLYSHSHTNPLSLFWWMQFFLLALSL